MITFPFVIKGFHSDNGSEYINKQVAKLLEKLLIEFTKSRARPYTIDLQSLKAKCFGVKLQDLRKQALYVRINSFHHQAGYIA